MEWYAHTGDKPDKSDWEPLPKHSEDVAEGGAERAAIFGAAEIVRAMGALHDVGKATEDFLRYLEGRGPSPDHSTTGAVIALKRYGDDLGKMMAFGIAGHHAGLANGARTSGLTDRLATAKPFTLPPDCDLAAKSLNWEIPAALRVDSFAASFFIRLLFSALCDADFIATERFYAELRKEEVDRGWKGELSALETALDTHLAKLKGKNPKVDAIRTDLRKTVLENAAQRPGLFSLTVPTGGGKTLTSLAFALKHALRHGMRRVIYVAPFTSVVEQTADVFREALGDDEAVLEHHGAFDAEKYFKEKGVDVEGAAGEIKLRRAAENWDRPVIVTTAVQFFDSLFANRTSKCRKLHNIAKSVVILDEAQTIPLKVLRPCLAAIRELARGYGTSLVLCTATQPAVLRSDRFPDGLEDVHELAPDVRKLFADLKRVEIERIPTRLSDDALMERLGDETSWLVIVNNRRHARELTELAKKHAPPDEVFHLSTHMCPAHRRDVLAKIKAREKDKLPRRVVATSLVEAGVDFSFPVVYRAAAGLESIAQAAGRCNRNDELRPEKGQVYVFTPDTEHKAPVELAQFADSGEAVLNSGLDPLSPEAIEVYFKDVYWTRGHDELDALELGESGTGVLAALEEYHEKTNYPFADIGQAFRLIDEAQFPIIVPYPPKDADEVTRLVDMLRDPSKRDAEGKRQSTGRIARALRSYMVQVRPHVRAKLRSAGSVEIINESLYGDQFVWLSNPDLYDEDIGLNWDDPTYLAHERLSF